jgi:glycosyltransferase involved in cell wall biosynthesis
VLNEFRRRGALFREPFRFLAVRPGAFDLVHSHVFSVGMLDLDCALVVSNAAPIEALYADAERWSAGRVAFARSVDTVAARALGVVHNSYRVRPADRLVCFTDRLKDWYVSRGLMPPDRVDVVPCSATVPDGPPQPLRRPYRVGFIGQFEAKGGDLVLEAHRLVRRTIPDAELVFVGSEPRLPPEECQRLGITWSGRLPQQRLLNDIVPSLHAFAYPSRFDGLPLTLLEVMARGVPPVVSDYGALPEVVRGAGLVVRPEDSRALADALLELCEAGRHHSLGQAARERVRQRYSPSVMRKGLGEAYERALTSRSAVR